MKVQIKRDSNDGLRQVITAYPKFRFSPFFSKMVFIFMFVATFLFSSCNKLDEHQKQFKSLEEKQAFLYPNQKNICMTLGLSKTAKAEDKVRFKELVEMGVQFGNKLVDNCPTELNNQKQAGYLLCKGEGNDSWKKLPAWIFFKEICYGDKEKCLKRLTSKMKSDCAKEGSRLYFDK